MSLSLSVLLSTGAATAATVMLQPPQNRPQRADTVDALGAPTQLTLDSVAATTTSLSWTAPVGEAVQKNIIYGGATTPLDTGSGDTTYTLAGLTSGSRCYIQVAAVNAENEESAKSARLIVRPEADTHEALSYFQPRLNQAPVDAEFALAYVLEHARTPAQQQAVCDALIFKCDVLCSMLDALYLAYVNPAMPPPGAFIADDVALPVVLA